MATVYKVKIVSDFINYPKEELEAYLNETINKVERGKGNTIRVEITKKE